MAYEINKLLRFGLHRRLPNTIFHKCRLSGRLPDIKIFQANYFISGSSHAIATFYILVVFNNLKDFNPDAIRDQLTSGWSVYWQLQILCREPQSERNVMWNYIPPVNAMIVVWSLLFNVGLFMLLYCKSL